MIEQQNNVVGKGRLNPGLPRKGGREMNVDAGIKSSRARMRRLTVATLWHALPAMVFLSANFVDAATHNFANVASSNFANPMARNFANLASRNLASPAVRNFAHLATPQVANLAPSNFANSRPRTFAAVPPRLFAPITRHVHRATQLYWFSRPTVSPYLNLTIQDSAYGLPNYHTFVRPQLQRRQSDMQRRMRPSTSGAPLNASSLYRYFPALRR